MSYWSGDNLNCPICLDIFRDPVLVPCGHSFCKSCWQRWWNENPNRACPVCQERSSLYDPPQNLALKNQCEAFSRDRGSGTLHANHVSPINEAARDHKMTLRELLRLLRDKLELVKDIKENFDQTAKNIEVQAQDTERQIKDVFLMLQKFLKKEEEARMTALNAEKQQKSQMMKRKSEALSRETAALSQTIRATEEVLKFEDVQFFQNYKSAAERVQLSLLDAPDEIPGSLIDMEKHLKNLSTAILDRMKEMISSSHDFLGPNPRRSPARVQPCPQGH